MAWGGEALAGFAMRLEASRVLNSILRLNSVATESQETTGGRAHMSDLLQKGESGLLRR
jgi:hypothetical protein